MSAKAAPAASRQVLMFSPTCWIWARMSPLPTQIPCASRANWPATKIILPVPLTVTTWRYLCRPSTMRPRRPCGRVMFGAGPGLLASDALMLGINPMTQRDRMAEGIDVILRLFRDESVTEKTDWYTLVNARLHLPPYTKPYPEMAVVSAVTPSGGRLAGKYDLSMICVAATNPFGYDALASNWQIACDVAADHGRTMDPNRLRLAGPMHIARTREQAFANARWGFARYLGYLNNNQ